MPAISLLLPTYEPQPAHLREAMDSIIHQTFTDWEVLIHDDASTVDVRAIVEPYLADPRVRFVKSPHRLGIGGNWNACLHHTSAAPLVQYLFQDDAWNPDYLHKTSSMLQNNPTIGFVAANHHYTLEGEAVEALRPIYDEVTHTKNLHLQSGRQDRMQFLTWWIQNGLRPNVIGEPSFVMLRRDLIHKIGPFNATMPQGLDVDYWLRLLLHADWYYIPDSLGFFRVHASAATARNAAAGHGLFDRLQFFDLLLQNLPAGNTRTLTKLALRTHVALMIKKFFSRVEGGGSVGKTGMGSAMKICLKHPLLVTGSVYEFITVQSKKKKHL